MQSFIGEQVVPLVQRLKLPWQRDKMGGLLVELGPERADQSLMLMAYAMTHPANRMPNPFAGELIDDATGAYARPRRLGRKGSLAAALAAVKKWCSRASLRAKCPLLFQAALKGTILRHFIRHL